jgi:hypothetical protein
LRMVTAFQATIGTGKDYLGHYTLLMRERFLDAFARLN